jgi:hypothetical protein
MATKRLTAKRAGALVDKVQALAQRHSKREVARMLGVSDRSVRRWLSGEAAPIKLASDATTKKKLDAAVKRENRAISKERKKQKIPSFAPMQPPMKRITYRDAKGPSETLEGDLRRTPSSTLFKMIKNYRQRMILSGKKAVVRFFGKGSEMSDYPGAWHWSTYEDITDYDDEELDEFLESLNLWFDDITKVRIDTGIRDV